MKIAVASGKGGTGKTTVATSLAWVAARAGCAVAYLDCDVEEPNGHIFLRPEISLEEPIEKPLPVIDAAACTHCGRCAEVCRYGAVASLPQHTMVFAELCHGCGGCQLACPAGAISEAPRVIGRLRHGHSGSIRFREGELNIGEAMSPPAIHAVKASVPPAELVILDAPPGTSCPAIEAVRGADCVLMVTEPTPFGLYDLSLAVEMVRALALPAAVVVNRSAASYGLVHEFCGRNHIPVWGELPDDRSVAEAYSRGRMPCQDVPDFRHRISALHDRLTQEVVA